MNNKIVIIDSGIGGLHILNHCENLLTDAKLIYIADTLNAPYGSKNKKELRRIAVALIQNVKDRYNPRIIVLACNTLTVNSINYLRKKFTEIKFIGTEPALKRAIIYGGDTLVLSTPSTKKHISALHKKIIWQIRREHKKLHLRYYHDSNLYKLSIKNLATAIETNLENLDNVIPLLQRFFSNTKHRTCQNLVIGCTHYTAIIPQIQQVLPNVQIFDGCAAVAKQILRVRNELDFESDKKPTVEFISTDNKEESLQKIKKYYLKIRTIN